MCFHVATKLPLWREAPLCKDFCWWNSPAQISRWCWVSPTLPSQDTAPAGEGGPGSAELRQIQGRVMVSASPEGITASWDTPERGSQGWSQSWEQGPGQGKLFFRQVMDDCPGKCEWWAQGRKGCCGRNECAVKSLFLFNLRLVKSRRITRISP